MATTSNSDTNHHAWCLICIGLVLSMTLCTANAQTATIGESRQPPPHKWTKFVPVDGQPEPVPAEWVSTPEGKFAHSIRIPNPVPKDSGYRRGMSAKEYFDHLCKQEAGEFIYKTAANVEGFLFMRPPARPTDYDLMDRYKLEAPSFERVYQRVNPGVARRGAVFVEPPYRAFRFYEEAVVRDKGASPGTSYIRASEIDAKLPRLNKVEQIDRLTSQYGVLWRGIHRPRDRENLIAGTEVIVIDLRSKEVMGVLREFGITGKTSNVREGIWWLNAANCEQFSKRYPLTSSKQMYEFVAAVLNPKQ